MASGADCICGFSPLRSARLCAWRRRGLNKRVQKEEERAKAKKEQEDALEDTKLDITPRILVPAPGLVLAESFPAVEISFKNRTNNPRRPRPFGSIDNLSFKNRSNNTRRNRAFGSIDTVPKLWSQTTGAGVFGEIGDFMVLSAVIRSSSRHI
jgi:hypothetical protein